MTLSKMVSYVCGKVSQNEPEDQAVCRTFLQTRHDSAWADQLWKDSIYAYTQDVVPSNYTPTSTWLPTKQILLCATEFEHILAVRTAIRRLDVETPETFYRSNFDQFSNTGDARQFMDLPRAVWEFDTPQTLYLQNEGESETTVVIDTVGSDLITRERTKLTIPSGITMFRSNVNRIDGFSKLVSDGAVDIGLLVQAGFIVTYTANSGTLGVGLNGVVSVTLNPGESTTLSPVATDQLFLLIQNPDTNVFSGDINAFGLNGTLSVDGGFTKTFVAAALSPILSIAAADTNAPLRCRIQPVGTLPNPTTLRLLGKARLGTFEEDNDEPLIAGMDKVLIEMGVGDMWERERQFGFAQTPFQRGTALLEQLKKVQTVQTAYNKRLIPDGGYADEWQLNSGIYTVFP